MKCDSWPSHLTSTFASPCLGHEPKAGVVTTTQVEKSKEITIHVEKSTKYKGLITIFSPFNSYQVLHPIEE
jgi:hypothetical protein